MADGTLARFQWRPRLPPDETTIHHPGNRSPSGGKATATGGRVASNPSADPTLLSMHAMELLASSIESAHDGKDGKDGLVAQVLDLIWTGSHRGLTMEQLCASVGADRRTVELSWGDKGVAV